MKRFREWLSGDILKQVKARCQPFLNTTHHPLYRGIWMMDAVRLGMGKEVQVFKDRKPRDSDPIASKLIDDWFEEHHGIRPRSQGLFCSGKINEARIYGTPVYTFPIGNFKYVWGVEKEDGNPMRDSLFLSNMIKDRMRVSRAAEAPKIVAQIMDLVEWHTDKLEAAQATTAEIVVLVDSAYLLPHSKYEDSDDLMNKLLETKK